eukprot:TRINITY_DN2610_c0_g2_i1.p1 TRINITY_DN2610_c0_g2~~TRINITY_DN2610_c0_g2_i1.p1  ORF type:complete len:430 (-),score=86.74 TRINITY_DN2610_c0_g2_i1:144-1433(-)
MTSQHSKSSTQTPYKGRSIGRTETPETGESWRKASPEAERAKTFREGHEWKRLGEDIDYLKYEVDLVMKRSVPRFDYDFFWLKDEQETLEDESRSKLRARSAFKPSKSHTADNEHSRLLSSYEARKKELLGRRAEDKSELAGQRAGEGRTLASSKSANAKEFRRSGQDLKGYKVKDTKKSSNAKGIFRGITHSTKDSTKKPPSTKKDLNKSAITQSSTHTKSAQYTKGMQNTKSAIREMGRKVRSASKLDTVSCEGPAHFHEARNIADLLCPPKESEGDIRQPQSHKESQLNAGVTMDGNYLFYIVESKVTLTENLKEKPTNKAKAQKLQKETIRGILKKRYNPDYEKYRLLFNKKPAQTSTRPKSASTTVRKLLNATKQTEFLKKFLRQHKWKQAPYSIGQFDRHCWKCFGRDLVCTARNIKPNQSFY